MTRPRHRMRARRQRGIFTVNLGPIAGPLLVVYPKSGWPPRVLKGKRALKYIERHRITFDSPSPLGV